MSYYNYSRKLLTEKKRNTRNSIIFIFLTLLIIGLFIFQGLPAIIKFSAFLTELRKSSEPIDTSDTTPPPPPIVNTLPSYTNVKDININGTTEAGATVIITFNAEKNEILSNSEGRFSFSEELNDGENIIYLTSKDSSGNESQKTPIYKITYDTIPPELEIIKPKDGDTFYGSKERQIVFDGKSEAEAKVSINGRQVIVDGSGIFSYATTLEPGENNFIVRSEDQAGNKTEKNLKVTFNP